MTQQLYADRVAYMALHIALAKVWARGETVRAIAGTPLERAGLAQAAGPLPDGVARLGGAFAADCGAIAGGLPDAAAVSLAGASAYVD